MRLLCGKLTFCRHSIVPYILANWLPVLPSTSWCAKVSLHGTILGQMSHPQAEDLFCQAHVTFPNTGRQPPILVDSKSVLIVFIVDGALFLFQLLFDLQCSSMGGTKRVLFACVSVCVCVCVSLSFGCFCVCGSEFHWTTCPWVYSGKIIGTTTAHASFVLGLLTATKPYLHSGMWKIIQGKSFTSQKRLIPSTPNSDIGSAPNVHPLFCCNPTPQWMWSHLTHLI